jgi:c-di-GMP-binding flagellar brake protein YcgR
LIHGKDILAVNHKICITPANQSTHEAIITSIEENIFWINFPSNNKQPLFLTIKQNVEISTALKLGLYTGNTTLEKLNNDSKKFYGFLIPDNFIKTRARKYRRSLYSNNLTFKAGNLTALTTMIDFSAGGVQVYLTPNMENIINSKHKIFVSLQIENNSFYSEVRLSWQNKTKNIPIAGFEFINNDNLPGGKIANLSIKYTT